MFTAVAHALVRAVLAIVPTQKSLADPVAGRVVIADPDFAARLAGDGAAHFARIIPDQLRVVTAHAVTDVAAVAVIARFRCPVADHLARRSVSTADFEEIFAEDRMRPVVELAFLEQMAGPLLGAGGQAVRPSQRRYIHAHPYVVVSA